MTMRILFFVIAFFIIASSCGQQYDAVYLNTKDSSVNYYVTVMPEHSSPEAFMVLVPGAFQTPGQVLQQTDLPQYAAQQGVLVIIPLSENGINAFGIDSSSQRSLQHQISDAVVRYHLEKKPFYLGGFSLGGSAAIKYAEDASGNTAMLLPTAVFAIDPPLDFERYYNAARRVVRLSAAGKVNQEVPYMIERIEKEMGGTPQTVPGNFRKLSPYSYTDETQASVKNLINMPLMIITEPDVNWWLQERGYDYTFMNSTDQAAMINELCRLGNKNAHLITTSDKGFREPGHTRHPHSFSIVDKVELLAWLKARHE